MIPFTKAHACGNDFLIIREEDADAYDKAELAQRLCERNTGIGADGVEFVESLGEHAARIHLINADGSEAEISGNGTRCVAAWMANELNSQPGDELSIQTGAGIRTCKIESFRKYELAPPTTLITIDMDIPEFEEKTIELADGTQIKGVHVNMGNPHFVILLDRLERNDFEWNGLVHPNRKDATEYVRNNLDFTVGEREWQEIGEEICLHPDFPHQTNVEFVRILGTDSREFNQVGIAIFERGVGPTSSSGTGTSATATAMIGVYGAQSPLEVIAPGGAQTVDWAGPGEKLYLTGPATLVARGEAW